MTAARRALAALLYRARLCDGPTLPGRRLVVFNYHRVLPDDGARPFDDGVFGPTAAELEAQFAWLARSCRVLDEQQLVDGALDGRWPAGRLEAITFDDAYREQHAVAWPLLRKHGLPAIFFVPTALVDERRLGWWDLLAWSLKRTRRDALELDGARFPLPARRAAAIRWLHARMKLEPAERTADLVGRVAAACEVAPPDASAQDAALMTWDEVRAIAADGRSAIGSHAHSHRVLATLPVDEQERELRASRAILARETGRAPRSLAYPVGGPPHVLAATRAAARRVGFALAFSYGDGANPRALDRFDIRRSSAGDEHALPLVAAAAALPAVFA